MHVFDRLTAAFQPQYHLIDIMRSPSIDDSQYTKKRQCGAQVKSLVVGASGDNIVGEVATRWDVAIKSISN